MDWAEGKALRLLTDFAGPLLARVCDALPIGFEPVARALNNDTRRKGATQIVALPALRVTLNGPPLVPGPITR